MRHIKSVQLRDDFLSIASHELRTPLTPIRVQLGLIACYLQKITPDSPIINNFKKVLKDTQEQFERFLGLVEDLLDVSRITADRLILHRQRFNLSEVVREAIQQFMPQFAKAGCQVGFDLEEDIEGFLDRARFKQVLVNLITNAVKYGAKEPVEIRLIRKNDHAEFSIQDYGIGISVEDQKRIFGRFERAASVKQYGGLGIGLFITRQIVEVHGGSIRVKSELGQGSCFIVDLPLHLEPEVIV